MFKRNFHQIQVDYNGKIHVGIYHYSTKLPEYPFNLWLKSKLNCLEQMCIQHNPFTP